MKYNKENAFSHLLGNIPFCKTLGIEADYFEGNVITFLPFKNEFIGNQAIPALHGGVIGAFLEITAIIELSYSSFLAFNNSSLKKMSYASDSEFWNSFELPKTIDITMDYLTTGMASESLAKAKINRLGRRYASVSVDTWQNDPKAPFARAHGHFLLSSNNSAGNNRKI